ncbi:DUF4293 domain-containing protein [bacterium]|nr:DUF4293 domain-containing protein [bacterium]
MIQRPQTLYFLAIVAMVLMMCFSDIIFYEVSSEKTDANVEVMYNQTVINADGDSEAKTNSLLLFFIGSIGLIALVAMLMFKSRKMQVTLSGFNALFILASLYFMYRYSLGMDYFEQGEGNLTFSALLPFALLLFNIFAMMRIRKDEKLVRSMDRIR